MEFLLGAVGAAVVMGSFFAGVAFGKRAVIPAPKAMEETEARRMREGQEAFRCLQNYSAEQAYGMFREGEVNT